MRDNDLYEPYDEDDDDEFEDDLDPEEKDCLLFNDLVLADINHELVALDTRTLLEFLTWELDKLRFTDSSELILIGIDFESQYRLQFYNVREDQTVKVGTGAGNIYMLVDGWILKTLTDLYVTEMYGEIAEVYPDMLTDIYVNILADVVEWKKDNEIEVLPSKSPEDDEPDEDK